jgi:DNA-directed RNA polymerase subunit omega
MARITIDECLDKVDNRFALVAAASKRARQLHGTEKEKRARPTVNCNNKEVVTALREIAAGTVEIEVPEEVMPKK